MSDIILKAPCGANKNRKKVGRGVVNVADLENKFEAGEIVTWEALVERNLIKAKDVLVKILGSGDLTKALTVEMLDMSASAKEKIEKAGGKIVEEEIGR